MQPTGQVHSCAPPSPCKQEAAGQHRPAPALSLDQLCLMYVRHCLQLQELDVDITVDSATPNSIVDFNLELNRADGGEVGAGPSSSGNNKFSNQGSFTGTRGFAVPCACNAGAGYTGKSNRSLLPALKQAGRQPTETACRNRGRCGSTSLLGIASGDRLRLCPVPCAADLSVAAVDISGQPWDALIKAPVDGAFAIRPVNPQLNVTTKVFSMASETAGLQTASCFSSTVNMRRMKVNTYPGAGQQDRWLTLGGDALVRRLQSLTACCALPLQARSTWPSSSRSRASAPALAPTLSAAPWSPTWSSRRCGASRPPASSKPLRPAVDKCVNCDSALNWLLAGRGLAVCCIFLTSAPVPTSLCSYIHFWMNPSFDETAAFNYDVSCAPPYLQAEAAVPAHVVPAPSCSSSRGRSGGVTAAAC